MASPITGFGSGSVGPCDAKWYTPMLSRPFTYSNEGRGMWRAELLSVACRYIKPVFGLKDIECQEWPPAGPGMAVSRRAASR